MTDVPAPSKTRKLGRFELLKRLGRGGMGEVWLARDPKRAGTIALKRLLPGDGTPSASTAERTKRFAREAKAAMAIDHPGIAKVLELGSQDGRPYIAMEYIEGDSLQAVCGDRPMDPRRAAEIAHSLAGAMAAAHAAGVLHRDLKPANVLIDTTSRPRIVDFGLARLADGTTLTATGQVMGTPGYMSPEQIGGDPRRVGPAADVYGLGAILYQMLTGRPPFSGEGLVDVIFQVVSNPPDPPSRFAPGLDPTLESICLRCLEKSPKHRFATAAALEVLLGRWLAGDVTVDAARPARDAADLRAPAYVPRALPWWRRLVDLARRAFQRRRTTIVVDLERAAAAEHAGNTELARSMLEDAIERDPSSWEARAHLAEMMLRKGSPAEAAFYFYQAFEAASAPQTQAMMAFRAVDVLRELGRIDAARSILARAQGKLVGSRYESYLVERIDQLDQASRTATPRSSTPNQPPAP